MDGFPKMGLAKFLIFLVDFSDSTSIIRSYIVNYLAQLLDSKMDSLDSPDFDPIAYINQKFPTEASLDGLDSFSTSVNSQICYLDEELSQAIQTQSVSGKQATQVLLVYINWCI